MLLLASKCYPVVYWLDLAELKCGNILAVDGRSYESWLLKVSKTPVFLVLQLVIYEAPSSVLEARVVFSQILPGCHCIFDSLCER